MSGENRIEFLVDTDAVEKFIGAGMALASIGQDKKYLDSVINAAFNEAEIEFNRDAAAVAQAGGGIKHMFEWGTVGINNGRTNVRPNPLSERARLWNTKLVGVGLEQVYTYHFKPSMAFVPKPTVGGSGMKSDVIAKMRDHIFWNKAAVYETGMFVHIEPKDAQFLLIPNYEGSNFQRPNDIKRGYRLSKGPMTGQPGREVAGNFTTFWRGWWDESGVMIIDTKFEEFISGDFLPDLMVNTRGVPKRPNNAASEAKMLKEQQRVMDKARAEAYARQKMTEGAKEV